MKKLLLAIACVLAIPACCNKCNKEPKQQPVRKEKVQKECGMACSKNQSKNMQPTKRAYAKQ